MISESDIESKDFSLALPWAIDKLAALQTLLIQGEGGDRVLAGVGCILADVVEELDTINKTLYPDPEQSEA